MATDILPLQAILWLSVSLLERAFLWVCGKQDPRPLTINPFL
jgi:hypothetical protein